MSPHESKVEHPWILGQYTFTKLFSWRRQRGTPSSLHGLGRPLPCAGGVGHPDQRMGCTGRHFVGVLYQVFINFYKHDWSELSAEYSETCKPKHPRHSALFVLDCFWSLCHACCIHPHSLLTLRSALCTTRGSPYWRWRERRKQCERLGVL